MTFLDFQDEEKPQIATLKVIDETIWRVTMFCL